MPKWVFVHIPKTAGTSFQNALRQVLGNDAVSPSFNASELSEAEAERLDKYSVISGHISITDVNRYFPDRRILTILRDPLERCISWYFFARMTPPVDGSPSDVFAAQQNGIEEFFSLDKRIIYRNIFNRQVRQLGDHVLNMETDHVKALERAKDTVSSAAWVGRQEHLADDLADLAEAFPQFSGLSLGRLNCTIGKMSSDRLNPETARRILEFNAYDVELYAHAAGRTAGHNR